MNVIFTYRQSLYIEIDMFSIIFDSLSQALSNMFLTMIETVKVTQGITSLTALKDDFPAWKYFVGEFDQYITGNKRV